MRTSVIGMMLLAGVAQAQALHGDALVKALRQGGYVVVMRHTSSPREVPDKKTANADNVKPERQLDEEVADHRGRHGQSAARLEDSHRRRAHEPHL